MRARRRTTRVRFVTFRPSRAPVDPLAILGEVSELEGLSLHTPRVEVSAVCELLGRARALRHLSLGESWLSPVVLEAVAEAPGHLESMRLNLRHGSASHVSALLRRNGLERITLSEPNDECVLALRRALVGSDVRTLVVHLPGAAVIPDALRLVEEHGKRVSVVGPQPLESIYVGDGTLRPSEGFRDGSRPSGLIVDACVTTLPSLSEDTGRGITRLQLDSTLVAPRALSSWLTSLPALEELTVPASLVAGGLRAPRPIQRVLVTRDRYEEEPSPAAWCAFLGTAAPSELRMLSLSLRLEAARALPATCRAQVGLQLGGRVERGVRAVMGERLRVSQWGQ